MNPTMTMDEFYFGVHEKTGASGRCLSYINPPDHPYNDEDEDGGHLRDSHNSNNHFRSNGLRNSELRNSGSRNSEFRSSGIRNNKFRSSGNRNDETRNNEFRSSGIRNSEFRSHGNRNDEARNNGIRDSHRSNMQPTHGSAAQDTVSTASSFEFTVEDPQDSSARAWFIVVSCAVLHLCSEMTYFLFFNTSLIAPYRNARLVNENKQPTSTFTDIQSFVDVRIAGEFVAAMLSLFFGYRLVAVVGSLCTLGGFLGASFIEEVHNNTELFHFLVGGLGGFGCATWRYAAYVAVMEYFKKTRKAALICSGLGRVAGIFIGYGVLVEPLRTVMQPNSTIEDIENMTGWHIYYKCVCGPAGVALIASITLTPLPICKIKDEKIYGYQALKYRTWNVFGSGFFWLTLITYSLYYLGESVPNVNIIGIMLEHGFESTYVEATMFILAGGVALGYILLAFWQTKNRFYNTFIAIGAMLLVLGLLALQWPFFQNYHFAFVVAYVALHGFMQAVFETLIRYVIPISFSRQYIWLTEGMLGLFGGGGIIVSNFVADELKTTMGLKEVFYFAGFSLIAAGVVAVGVCNVMRCCHVKDENLETDFPYRRMHAHDFNHHNNSHHPDDSHRNGIRRYGFDRL